MECNCDKVQHMIDDNILNEIAIYAAIVFFAGSVAYIAHLLISGDY